jgi:hypothetical protein
LGEERVACEQHEVLLGGLRNQQAVEWIAVETGKLGGALRVRPADTKLDESRLGSDLSERNVEMQTAGNAFHGRLPDADGAQMNLVVGVL